MQLESDLLVPTSTSHLTLASRVWPLGEGRANSGVVRTCESGRERGPSSPRWAFLLNFSLGWEEEERESSLKDGREGG